MSRYVKICRDMSRCQAMSRYVEICRDMSRYVKMTDTWYHLIPSDPRTDLKSLGTSVPRLQQRAASSQARLKTFLYLHNGLKAATWRCQMDQMVKKTTKCHIFSGNLSFHTSSSCWFINSSTDLLSISLPYFERDEHNWTQHSARCTKTSRVRNLSVRHILIMNLGHGENCEGCGLPAVCQRLELCCLSEI